MATDPGSDRLLRILLIVIGVVILLPVLMMAVAFPMVGMMGWWGSGGVLGSPLWGFGMMVVWLLVLVGIGYVVYRAITSAPVADDDPAMEELRLAYARGDLSDEEFENRRDALEETR